LRPAVFFSTEPGFKIFEFFLKIFDFFLNFAP